MMDKIQEILERAGAKDFDDLNDIEKETYFQMLEIAESGKITLEEFKKSVKRMRESVEYTLASEDLPKNKDLFLKARLKCYIIFEAFFEKPERAREMLEQYGKSTKRR
jgi:hypothetical protein